MPRPFPTRAATPFDPATSFVARLHRDLVARALEVWLDRMAALSSGLTVGAEIRKIRPAVVISLGS